MSNTSEEESQNNFQQQSLTVGCIPVSSKGDTVTTATKKRRSLPDPDAEVIALSPRTLLATNRYVCEVCHKGFQRDQNLQLHRRGHNLPWKLKQRSSIEAKKRVFVCPEVSCTHHDPSRALGDLTGIKKHYSRKHGEKKWKCDKCSKRYAVQSDWKAHLKICGTKEYRCDCGTIFSRKDSFVTHRAFCDALTEENYRVNHGLEAMVGSLHSQTQDILSHSMPSLNSSTSDTIKSSSTPEHNTNNPLRSLSMNPLIQDNCEVFSSLITPRSSCLHGSGLIGSSYMSATALLQKAAEIGVRVSDNSISPILLRGFTGYSTTSRASGSVQDPNSGQLGASLQCLESSMENSTIQSASLLAVTSHGSFLGNQSEFRINSQWSSTDVRPVTFPPYGLINPPVPIRAEGLEGQMQGDTHEDLPRGRDMRMTQDFLGFSSGGNLGIDDHNYGDDPAMLNYSQGQQQNQQDIYSYDQMSQGPAALEKQMWGF
ncbi:zinc finger protein GAI-ASSOCIATED FACTOR 1-like [Typha latifolia]|uniref:zinc finger protein GAI-ASSOCIATED FACTOR 1-like n=1 Tax=Typha latifolia TaxID=4733 RepID=UPI003C2AC008